MRRALASAAFGGFCLLVGLGLVGPGAVMAAEGQSPAAHPEAVAPAVGEAKGEHEAAGEAEHEHEHEAGIDAKKLALQLLNFGVLLFILIKFGGSAINKALLARHQQLKADLASAAQARAEAEERLRKQELRMANLEKEITQMRAGIQQEAEAEKARLVAAAEERAKRMREETAFMIEQQVKEGEATLRREAANVAIKIAGELLQRSMDGRDQQRLLDGFVEDVGGSDADALRKVV
ncbi:MAG: F-type H+-transporting ATPase subunit b [Myxococcales bacterium]|nr:F-type H+-transporting ATPase subunit b [Myxococcales bacterium]